MRTTAVAVVVATIAGAAHADDTWGTWTPDPVPTSSEAPVYSSTIDPVYTTAEPTSTIDVIPIYGTEAPVYSSTEDPVYTTTEVYPTYGTEEPVYTTTVSTDDATPTTTEGDAWASWTGTSTTTPEIEATPSSTTSCTESTETTSKAAVYTSKATYESPVYTTKSTYDTPDQPDTTQGWEAVYESSTIVYDSTTTLTSTIYETVTVWPTETATATPTATWAEWASTSSWSSSGWWGPSWPTAGPGQCVINVVTSYGEPIWVPETSKPATSSAPAVYTTAPAVYTTAPAVYTTASAPAYSAPAYSAPSASPSTPSGGSGGMTPNGNYWGMTYSPYTASSDCKTKETVDADIKKIAAKGFSSVRVYGTECHTLEYVGAACKDNNLKIILGVFISDTGVGGAQKQIADIAAWGQWDLVELIVVGNEAVFNHHATADELAGLISSAKGTFRDHGYTGAVTTTEDLATWTSVGSKWCGVVDVVAANLYAYFNPDTTPDKAGDLIQAQLDELSQVCGDKDTYVMESGWPSEGQCNNKACPGKEEQATAIKSIQATNGAKVIFFSYEDELWKTPGEYGVEQHWGCGDVFPDKY